MKASDLMVAALEAAARRAGLGEKLSSGFWRPHAFKLVTLPDAEVDALFAPLYA